MFKLFPIYCCEPMRINKWLAQNTELSRRKADVAVESGHVKINGQVATIGSQVGDFDEVMLGGNKVYRSSRTVTIMLNKPIGYICSRSGQGGRTIYELLPEEFRRLKPVGRLDKDSTGLLLMTNDGDLLNDLTHPSKNKEKTYWVKLNKPLPEQAIHQINVIGVEIGDDRLSRFSIDYKNTFDRATVVVKLAEGRNRQIRRTFEAMHYEVEKLHRVKVAGYELKDLPTGEFKEIVVK